MSQFSRLRNIQQIVTEIGLICQIIFCPILSTKFQVKFVQVIAFVVIFVINTTSDISKLLYEISRAVRQVKFETILKYRKWYLCQISRTNHAIICLYYQVFQIKLKYHCSKPIKLQEFFMQQYKTVNLGVLVFVLRKWLRPTVQRL